MILSIIVPVYNVEAYLKKCLDSLLNQDLRVDTYEILLIDDGSTDASGRICDEYAQEFGNIRVFHQKNEGLSSARNHGIWEAQGRFIQFVDSDDYLTPDVLGTLIRQIEDDSLDILRFNYQNVDENGKHIDIDKTPKLFIDYSSEPCDGISFLNERLGYACYAVQFVIKTDLVRHEKQWFKQGIYFEDAEWTPRIILQAERIASTDLIVYNYFYRNDSITKNPSLDKRKKIIEDKLSLIDSYLLQKTEVSDNRWFKGMIGFTVVSIITEVSRSFFKQRRPYLRTLKEKGVFPLYSYHPTVSAKRKISLINLSPDIACILMHYKNHDS